MNETIVILPTYNERENIAQIIREALSAGDDIDVVVVDDMSPDGTGEEVSKNFHDDPRVTLIEREGPRGRGYAGAEGFEWAVKKGYSYIIEMDADGSHNPIYLKDIKRELGKSDVAICSRFVPGGGEKGRSFSRVVITRLANMYLGSYLGVGVRDCTTGYRGFRRGTLEKVDWKKVVSPGPSIVQEVLYIAWKNGAKISEIPFMFEERRAGESKLDIRGLVNVFIEVRKIKRRHGI